MPILDPSRYPANWDATSRRIRFGRANNRCECTGQCGHAHEGGRCAALNHQAHPITGSRVVLTVAHLDQTPENSSDDNLLAMCQLCHNRLDGPYRAERRRARSAAKD